MRKNTTRLSVLALALILCLSLCACAGPEAPTPSVPADIVPGTETKTVTVEITHLDGSKRTETLETEKENLWDAMEEAGLIEGKDSTYGKFVTAVDGETADESLEQWWGYTKDGEYVDTACDSTPIADGDHFEFTLNTGYDIQ